MLRNLFIAVLLICGLYMAATVPLGERTLAEHVKAIGQTKEAKDLIDGTKSKLGPAASKIKDTVVQEVKQNVNKMQREILERGTQPQKATPEPPVQAR